MEDAGHRPGVGRFALFGEVLLTGAAVAACAIVVLTLPAALVAGIAHLRRFDFDLDLLASRGDIGEFGFHVCGLLGL